MEELVAMMPEGTTIHVESYTEGDPKEQWDWEDQLSIPDELIYFNIDPDEWMEICKDELNEEPEREVDAITVHFDVPGLKRITMDADHAIKRYSILYTTAQHGHDICLDFGNAKKAAAVLLALSWGVYNEDRLPRSGEYQL